MKTVRVGHSGLMVSSVCLGTMTFAREADEKTAFDIIDSYRDLGGFYLDTANVYSQGESEVVVGKWLKARSARDSVILATKVFGPTGNGPNDRGLSRVHIMREVENSLRRLQTDVIDLYQIHRMHVETPIEETVRALDDLVRDGKIRYVGSSNLKGYELMKYLSVADASLRARMISHQPAYSALNRSMELEILPLCGNEGVGLVTYNPLAGGFLTGKYLAETTPPAGSRMAESEHYRNRYFTPQAVKITEAFTGAAEERGLTPAQLALIWVLSEPAVTSAIVGARSVDQLTDTLAGADIRMTVEERATVPAVESGRWVGEDPVYDRGF